MSASRFDIANRALISAFLLFHLVSIACWCVPLDTPLLRVIRNGVGPYFRWTGLFQAWNMFAPEPMKVNSFIEAHVTFADNRSRTWKFPRMEQLSYRERYFRERYRKFSENLGAENNSALWPDVARHIARLNNQPSNPPAVIILIRYWSEIEPPGPNGAFRRKPWQGNAFFVYPVKPDDLR